MERYTTIFFAGNGSCAAQASRLVGSKGILGIKTKGIDVLINPYLEGDIEPYDLGEAGIAIPASPNIRCRQRELVELDALSFILVYRILRPWLFLDLSLLY